MIKKYLGDALFIVLAAGLAFMLAGTPHSLTSAPRPAPPPAVKSPAADTAKVSAQNAAKQKEMHNILKRNIFLASGSYSETAQAPRVENPYVLVGVVRETQTMKAIFREHTGAMVKAEEGQRLVDGFRVISVKDQQVALKRGSESKVMTIYGESLTTSQAQSGVKKPSGAAQNLVAVLEGSEKKAVFRDADGHISILRKNALLPDGSVISDIQSRSVTIREGKTETKLALSIEVPKLSDRKPVHDKVKRTGQQAKPPKPLPRKPRSPGRPDAHENREATS